MYKLKHQIDTMNIVEHFQNFISWAALQFLCWKWLQVNIGLARERER